jgi:hypothetical protein
MANWYMLHMAIWYILWYFGIFFPVLVCCTYQEKSGNPGGFGGGGHNGSMHATDMTRMTMAEKNSLVAFHFPFRTPWKKVFFVI